MIRKEEALCDDGEVDGPWKHVAACVLHKESLRPRVPAVRRNVEMTRRHKKHKNPPASRRPAAPDMRLPAKNIPPKRHAAMSPRRLWLFRIVLAPVSALLFLGIMELSLRLAGYGHSPRPIIRCRSEEFDGYVDNAKFSWRFFPRNLAREFEPFTLPSTKKEETYRIFVCGASAAEGVPDGSYSFARILEVMLRQRYPATSFEVINTAMTAINSHVVLPIVKDCARHKPDLFIVYLGNNEVVGPYGAGTVFAGMARRLWLIRLGIALKATRTGQFLHTATAALQSDEDAILSWQGMQMFLDKQVRLADDAMPTVYAHFESNLQDIRDTALQAGASVIFCTVASNLKDCPPFASLHRADLTDPEQRHWRQLYNEGVALEKAGDYAAAAERYLAAGRIDETYADLSFRLAACHARLGQFAEAGTQYTNAREQDTLRFRADNTINDIIRKTAAAGDRTVCLDFAEILRTHAANGIPGAEHFWEHVHLNFAGNYLLARSLLEQIESRLADKTLPGRQDIPSEAQCAQLLAYTPWDQYRLTEKVLRDFVQQPPFTNQLYHEEWVAALETQLSALRPVLEPQALLNAADEYRRAIENNSADWNLHFKFGRLLTEELNDYPAAAGQFAAVQKCVPHHHRGYLAMGQVLAAQGNINAAIDQYLAAIRWYPASADACYHLGVAYAGTSRFEPAEQWFRRTLALQPTSPNACNKLAETLDRQGKVDEAIKVCRRGVAVNPQDAMLRGNLGILLHKKGLRQEAIQELETALKLDPDSDNIRRVIQIVRNRP